MTLEKLALRHSVRSYNSSPLEDREIAKIRAAITAINTHEAGLHFKLVTNSPEAFAGFGRSYGMFKGVSNYIALTMDNSTYPDMEIKVGYYAQMLVMLCVGMGLGTCYVGATMSRKHLDIQMRAGWKLRAVITVGHSDECKEPLIARIAERIISSRKKMPEDFYIGDLKIEEASSHFPQLLPALKAVAMAPSSYNHRPTRIRIYKNSFSETTSKPNHYEQEVMAIEAEERRFLLSPINSVTSPRLDFDIDYIIEASVDDKSQLIDLGIALWNFEQLFPGYWKWGNPAQFIPLAKD